MSRESPSVAIVGAGVFGVSAAIELRRRGFRVELIDPGPLPSPLASSTDISKAVRVDYGADEFYTALAERSIDRWRAWNDERGELLFHEVGFLLMTSAPFAAGEFEADSFELLERRGLAPIRLDTAARTAMFPVWDSPDFVDGYYNPIGGWARADRVMEHLIAQAMAGGVLVREGWRCTGLHEQGSRVTGVTLEDGTVRRADFVVVSAGAWTPTLLPHLADRMWACAQPVVNLQPEEPARFAAERFPLWAADITRTGWYGFPASSTGIVKIGNHGPGTRVLPTGSRELESTHIGRLREFLAARLPDLADAPVAGGRLCLYCDTWDGNFWIDHDPDRPGLLVACGGSGHGFKFAPVLGEIIADVLEGRPNDAAKRFAWRSRGKSAVEAARHR